MLRLPFACLALAVLSPPVLARNAPPTAVPEARAAYYELRIYTPEPGKLAALNARFREHTLGLFAKHGMTNVAYWNEQASEQAPEGRVVYVLAYPSKQARDAAWKAFVSDPEWRAVAAASEANGKLVAKVESVFMTMTDYSPLLKLARP